MEQLFWIGIITLNIKIFVLVYFVLYVSRKIKNKQSAKKYTKAKKALKITPIIYVVLMIIGYFILTKPQEKIKPTDNTIIVLGNPATKDGKPSYMMKVRLNKALDVYNKQNIFTIIVSGSSAHNKFIEAEVMKQYLIEKGVAPNKIITEPKAKNTYENAQYSVQILDSLHLKRPIIVTSHPHALRSEKMFSYFIKDFVIHTPQPTFWEFVKKFPIYMFETVLYFMK